MIREAAAWVAASEGEGMEDVAVPNLAPIRPGSHRHPELARVEVGVETAGDGETHSSGVSSMGLAHVEANSSSRRPFGALPRP